MIASFDASRKLQLPRCSCPKFSIIYDDSGCRCWTAHDNPCALVIGIASDDDIFSDAKCRRYGKWYRNCPQAVRYGFGRVNRTASSTLIRVSIVESFATELADSSSCAICACCLMCEQLPEKLFDSSKGVFVAGEAPVTTNALDLGAVCTRVYASPHTEVHSTCVQGDWAFTGQRVGFV